MVNKPILVTGAHRSGTTWAGKLIAASSRVGYIHEPFGVRHDLGVLPVPIAFWFPYIDAENEAAYLEPVRNMLSWKYTLTAPRQCGHLRVSCFERFKRQSCFLAHRMLGSRPLIKDPLALLAAEWLAETFGVQPVVLIRHPAGFYSSLKRLGWGQDFSHFLRQPKVMERYLKAFQEEIVEYAQNEHSHLDQMVLMWRIVYTIVHRYRQEHPEWLFVRYEDLCENVMGGSEKIFAHLSLSFDSRAKARIEKMSQAQNPKDVPVAQHGTVYRDSAAAAWTWKTRLSSEEIDYLRDATEDVWRLFYTDDYWKC
jgi:hypothetical protein